MPGRLLTVSLATNKQEEPTVAAAGYPQRPGQGLRPTAFAHADKGFIWGFVGLGWFVLFETGSHVARAGFEFMIYMMYDDDLNL